MTATGGGTGAAASTADVLAALARPAVVIAALVCLAVAVVLGSR